ncbi:MAG: glycosyltransferase [Chloroflexota bacterium]
MLHIAQMIGSLGIGGAQKLQITLAEAFQKHDVSLTIINLHQTINSPIPNQLKALGARVLTFPAHYALDPARLWKVIRFLRREPFDVLQTHLTAATVVGAIAGLLTDIPVVATLHTAGNDPTLSRPARHTLETLALKYGARRVVAVGRVVAEAHRQRLGRKPIDIIPNAVASGYSISPEERMALRAEITGDPACPLVIAVGRLSPPKGYPDLIDAFAAVNSTHPSARLAIAGGGALYDEINARITARDLMGRVILLGARNDVPRLLAAGDIFVSASHWEGLPVAVLEAMAVGLPVVATSVGDVPDVVVPGTGLIVPPHQPAALATTIRTLLDDPEQGRQLGMAGRAHVVRNYAVEAWADKLLKLYSELQ